MFHFLLLFTLLFQHSAVCSKQDQFLSSNAWCLEFIETPRNWESTRQHCIDDGSELASVKLQLLHEAWLKYNKTQKYAGMTRW